MKLTVVIPTYNRADILRRTLRAYIEQTGDHRIVEILVVDDGSTDATGDVISECRGERTTVRSLYQVNQGLAAARNHAVEKAEGDLILFGDDDIIPSPSLAAEHVSWHEQYAEEEVGVLGSVRWLPELRPTPFMNWSGLYGPQFNFGFFKAGGRLPFQFGYFCNTSLRSSFLRKNGLFNEDLRTYGYEDLDLSYRLMKKGYKLFYNPRAYGYHNKFETFEDTLKRVDKLYGSWPEFAKTEAGEEFLRIWEHRCDLRQSTGSRLSKLMKRQLKRVGVPLLRPLLDTQIALPKWMYEQIFYHYVTPFGTVTGTAPERRN